MGHRLCHFAFILTMLLASACLAEGSGVAVVHAGPGQPASPEAVAAVTPPPVVAVADPAPAAGKYDAIEKRTIGGERAASGQDAAKTTKAADGGSGWLFNTLLALGGVLALIFVLTYLVRRWAPASLGGQRGNNSVRVVARTPLSPKQYVALVQLPRRMLVIGVTGQQITRLAEITDEQEIAQLRAGGSSGKSVLGEGFAQLLGKQSRQMADEPDEPAPPTATARGALGGLSRLLGQVKSQLARVQARRQG